MSEQIADESLRGKIRFTSCNYTLIDNMLIIDGIPGGDLDIDSAMHLSLPIEVSMFQPGVPCALISVGLIDDIIKFLQKFKEAAKPKIEGVSSHE